MYPRTPWHSINAAIIIIIIIIIIDSQANAWPFSVYNQKQGFGPRTANF